MIIDVHTHLQGPDVPSARHWDLMAKSIASLANRPEEKVRSWFEKKFDVTGDMLVGDMDEGGIDVAVCMTNDPGFLRSEAGENKYTIKEINKIFAQATERHKGRLYALFAVDPRRPEAVSMLETGVKEWGMKGLKLNPGAGFYPDDRRYCYPLYEKAQELGVVVLFHTGPAAYPYYTKYCEPKYIADVAVDFPHLKIIMGHAGNCWWQEASMIAGFHGNVYLDLAMWQPMMARNALERLYKPLRQMLDVIGRPKIMFATDWPAVRGARGMGYREWVGAFRNPPEAVKSAGIEFSEQEINAILGDTAAKLLGLVSLL